MHEVKSLKYSNKNVINYYRIELITVFILLLLIIPIVKAQNIQTKLLIGLYSPDVDLNNETISKSFRQWLEIIKSNAKNRQLKNMIVENRVFNNSEDLIKAINNTQFDLVNMTTLEYFQNKLNEKYVPVLAQSASSKEYTERLLLVKYNSGNENNFDQAVSQNIVLPNNSQNEIARKWLKLLLHEKLGKIKSNKINIISSAESDSKELFSIYLKKKGIAVIKEAVYNVAVELNPDINKKLHILAISPNLIHYFMCIRNNAEEFLKKDLLIEALDLHNKVEGKQILNLMKASRIYQITEKDLSETKNFYSKYYKIFNE